MNRNPGENITEHEGVKEALVETEERLRILSDNIPNGLVYQVDNEKPKGETVDYDQLIEAWRNGRVK